MLRGDCAEAIAEVDRMQTAQHSELNACVRQQQDALQGAAQSLSKWSSDMREAIHGQDTKVEVFVTQELQKDTPTGDNIVSHLFMVKLASMRPVLTRMVHHVLRSHVFMVKLASMRPVLTRKVHNVLRSHGKAGLYETSCSSKWSIISSSH